MKLIFNALGRNNRRRGFTLLEMLTVIAIITILIALLASFTSKIRARTRVSQVNVLLEKLQTGLEQYNLKFRSYPPAPPSAGYLGLPPASYPAGYNYPYTSQLLNYYLTTAFRINPDLSKGEVHATVNEGPFVTLEDGKELGSPIAPATANMPALKCIIDPWMNPLTYQLNKVQAADPMNNFFHTNNFIYVYTPLLYSWGPNGVDDTAPNNAINDDIYSTRKKITLYQQQQ